MTRFIARIFLASLTLLSATVVAGQDFPNKPVRIVLAGVGSSGDIVVRQIAQGISGPLGEQVIVDNRPGGIVPGQIVSQAPPDGYTLLHSGGGLWVGPLLQKTPYDAVRDFSPITLVLRTPNVLVVHPSLPVKSAKELIALAKARPGELNYASSTKGGSAHLAAELFKAMAGVNIVNIPYKSGGLALNDLLGGQVQLTFESPIAVVPHITSGRLRALAVTSAEPSALLPGLPTVTGSGLPGYDSTQLSGIFAPTKTPQIVISRLNQEIVRVLNQTDVKERFLSAGIEVAPSTPDQLAVVMKADMDRMGKVIRDAGIRAE